MSSFPALSPPPTSDPQDGSSGASGTSPTSPAAASPSPATPAPAMQQGTQMAIAVVSNLRTIAKAYPQTAPYVQQINDLMRKVMAGMMEHQSPGEPQAPPNAG